MIEKTLLFSELRLDGSKYNVECESNKISLQFCFSSLNHYKISSMDSICREG